MIIDFRVFISVSNYTRIRTILSQTLRFDFRTTRPVSSNERSQTNDIENAPITVTFKRFLASFETHLIVEFNFRLIDAETISTLFVCRFSITPFFPPVLHRNPQGFKSLLNMFNGGLFRTKQIKKIYLDTEVDIVWYQNVIFNFILFELYFVRDKKCHLPLPPPSQYPVFSISYISAFSFSGKTSRGSAGMIAIFGDVPNVVDCLSSAMSRP